MAAQKGDLIAAERLGIVGSVTVEEILALADVGSVASGSTLGLQQSILANAGQTALTVLVAGPATNGKLQGSSLGDGNVVEVYADGAAFNSGTVLYREFMSLGEVICFTGITAGAVVVATQGFYGFTEVEGTSATVAANQGVMPLMSFGLSFKSTFLYAFRGSTGATNDRGIITVANGPIANVIKLTDGAGVVAHGQENIELDPWELVFLDTDGNKEYILSGTEKMMACIMSECGGVVGSGLTGFQNGRAWDCRIVPPVSSDIIGAPRSGFISAPYDNTPVKWFDQQGDSGDLPLVSSGSPVDIDAASGTGNSQGDHNPAGYTRFRATGLVSAYSGADGQGGDAVAFFDVKAMSQVVAQAMPISDSGNADESSVTICSPYSGTAKIYEWNTTTSSLDLAYTVPLTRNSGISILSKEDQLHPCAGQVSNTTGNTNTIPLVGNLLPGVIIADVPIGVVIQNQSSANQITLRSQNGTTATAIQSLEDETATFGWTPDTLKAEITEGVDGILYKRVINAGVESWVVA